MNRYRTKSKEVTAIQLKQPMRIGDLVGMTGDWLVDDGSSQFFVAKEKFTEIYEAAPIIWPTNPVPDTYPGNPWLPYNPPMWPSGPIYWTSCDSNEYKQFSTGVNTYVQSCINFPRCIDGGFHAFSPAGTITTGVPRCAKCGKTQGEI